MQNIPNLLVVEDDDLDFEMFRRCMVKLGAEGRIVRARDGIDALEILRKRKTAPKLDYPYVIILDLNMPRMNGLEFLVELRRDETLHKDIVVVFSTSNHDRDVVVAYDHNVSGYVVKPATSTEMRNVLGTMKHFWEVCETPRLKSVQ